MTRVLTRLSKLFSKLWIPFGLLTNLLSAIALIQINKYIYINYGFPNLALTCLHFIITFVGLVICYQLKIFKMAQIPIIEMLPMSLTFCSFVVFTNFSLQYNSVGAYQCLKALTTPGVMIISIFYYKQSYSTKVKLTVLPVLIGLFLNSYYDLKFNSFGFIIGFIGATVSSLYQVWIGEKQKEFKINALQLLIYQAPLSAILLTFLIPFFEPLFGKESIFDFERSYYEWIAIFLSGLMAFLVNLSTYWIIGMTSALTYNMVGYFKFTLIIVVALILFKDPVKIEQVFALFLVMFGLVTYSFCRMKETNQEAETHSLENPSK